MLTSDIKSLDFKVVNNLDLKVTFIIIMILIIHIFFIYF